MVGARRDAGVTMAAAAAACTSPPSVVDDDGLHHGPLRVFFFLYACVRVSMHALGEALVGRCQGCHRKARAHRRPTSATEELFFFASSSSPNKPRHNV